MKPKLAILISGRGSNMAAILDRARSESWPADFCLVLSNRPDAAGLDYARQQGIPTAVIDHREYRGRRPEFDRAVAGALQEAGADWIILAGFMRILGPDCTGAFAGRILNIHPSLLPLYPGLNTHQRALDAGDSVAGCTVHLVDETLDGGRPLAQARVPILPGDSADSLAARVLVQEHDLYPTVIRDLIEGRIDCGTDRPQSGTTPKVEAPS